MPYEMQENRVLYTDGGEMLAEATFPAIGEALVNIDHTYVSEALRGQGVAGQLMERIAGELRRTHRKAALTCSYAQKWWAQHPEYADVLQ